MATLLTAKLPTRSLMLKSVSTNKLRKEKDVVRPRWAEP